MSDSKNNDQNFSSNSPESREEIDLMQLLYYFERKIKGLFGLIWKGIKLIFDIIILIVKPLFKNYQKIAIILFAAGVLGFVAERYKADLFSSSMLVRTYFNSKYQMVSNIAYYNSLIGDKNYNQLSSLFDMEEEMVDDLVYFEVDHGPENENTLLQAYDLFVRSMDSINRENITYDEYLENRSIYEGNLFSIKAVSKRPDIFGFLESGMAQSFENDYIRRKVRVRDSVISIKRSSYLKSLNEMDSLKQVYLRVMEEEAKSPVGEFNVGETGVLPVVQKTKTREYDLLERQLALRDSIRILDQEKAEEDVYFEILSGFQRIGQVERRWTDRYTLLFPAAAFALMVLVYLFFKVNTFVRNYEV